MKNKRRKAINSAKENGNVKDSKKAVKKTGDPLSQKASFFSVNGDIANIIIGVLVSFVCTYLYLPWNGTVSAVPFVLVGAFVCTFIKMHPLLKMAVFFVSPFSVSALMNETLINSLILGISCVVFYLLVSGAVNFFKKGKARSRIVAAVMVVLALSLHVFENSTPWNVYKNRVVLEEYIMNTYSEEPLYASEIKFDFSSRTYKLCVTPQDDMRISLDIIAKGGKIIEDQYVEYSEKYNMIVGAGRITEILNNSNPELRFKVESNQIKGYPFDFNPTINPTSDLSKYMDYSIYFTSYNDVEKFSELADECFRKLINSGFCCRTITFYGGISTRYIAKISVPFNSSVSHLSNFVTPCDDNMFVYTALK